MPSFNLYEFILNLALLHALAVIVNILSNENAINIVLYCIVYPSIHCIHPLFHGLITRWCPMHTWLLFSTRLCLVPSFSECIFPRYTILLHRPAIPFLVVLFLFPLSSPRTPPLLPVCYLPFYRCVQISSISSLKFSVRCFFCYPFFFLFLQSWFFCCHLTFIILR